VQWQGLQADGMPTLTVTHEAPLELIRQHPDLTVDLVRAMTGVPVPDDARADLGPTSLNAVVPAEFTADSVVTVSDRATRKPVPAIVVELQGRARQILEDMMSTAEWKDDFIESYVQIGIEQGREQGLEQGAANAKAQAVLKVMDARGLRPTQEQRAKITATAGITQLDLDAHRN
jgi:hypothetical protein